MNKPWFCTSIDIFKETVTQIRNIRNLNNYKNEITICSWGLDFNTIMVETYLIGLQGELKHMCNTVLKLSEEKSDVFITPYSGVRLYILNQDIKTTKDLTKERKELTAINTLLSNKDFCEKAPPHVIEQKINRKKQLENILDES